MARWLTQQHTGFQITNDMAIEEVYTTSEYVDYILKL